MYSPNCGTSTVIVPPNSVKYLGSSVSDPEAEEVLFQHSFDVDEVDPPEGADEESSEGESESSEHIFTTSEEQDESLD